MKAATLPASQSDDWRNDWSQIGVTPLEMFKQQGAILIEHVPAGPEIARGPTSDVVIPHSGDSRPVEPVTANIRRFAIPRQEAKASGVALGNIQDRFG